MKTFLAWGVPLLWLATLGSSVAVIYVRHRAAQLSFELSQEQARHRRLELAWGQLQLEKSRRESADPDSGVRGALLTQASPQIPNPAGPVAAEETVQP